MTDHEKGPPEEERPPKGPINSLGSHHTTPAGIEYTAGLRRRRATSWRLVPLDCGCRDPWPCRCIEPPLTDGQLDGWRLAAEYVIDTTGELPLIPTEILRAWYRRGGTDRELAERLHKACGGQAA